MAVGGQSIIVTLSILSALSSADDLKWWQREDNVFTSRVTAALLAQPTTTAPDDSSCSCVLPLLCRDVKGLAIHCGDSGKVCCSHVVYQSTSATPTHTETVSTASTTPLPSSALDLVQFQGQKDYKSEGCGVATPQSNYDHKTMLDKGDDLNAAENEFPWTLNLLENINMSGKNVTKVICAAVLVSYRSAVTAAHCVERFRKNHDNVIVRAGEWRLNADVETLVHRDSHVSKLVIHPDYIEYGLHSDIAVLILQPGFQEAVNIRPICTPGTTEKVTYPCYATGWGARGIGKNNLPSFREWRKLPPVKETDIKVSPDQQATMKKIPMQLLSANACEQQLQATNLGKRFRLNKSSICARGVKGDTGMGDGGGPLFCVTISDPPRYSLVGITSWGKFNYPGTPGVYTFFRKFSEWTEDELMKLMES